MSENENLDSSSEALVRFDQLGLNAEVLKAVDDLGYTQPTPVQAQSIPQALAGRDVLAAAQTGTGKTAAFLLPTMNNLPHVGKARGRGTGCGPLMLVVTPTRELAQQIEEVCRAVSKRTGHSSLTVVGGVSYNPQRNALRRGCDILIATPGRLIDLMNQGAAQLDQVQVLVLDEADRMLDMGFLPDIRKIVSHTRNDRQTLLFSATLDEKAVGSITDLVKDPARVEIAPATSTAETVDQYYLPVSLEAKNALLAQVLKKAGTQRVIVFTRTKHRADAVRRRLVRAGISCAVIHGDRTQNQRERALRAFRTGDIDVLVATDVLARGIDIVDVAYVVNFDVPKDPVDYIHRIGRTGRGGDVGWSLTIVTEQDVNEFHDIEALMGKTVDAYDTAGLELGENPVWIDPDRVPAAKVPGKKAKKKRRSASKKKAQAKDARTEQRNGQRKGAAPKKASGKPAGERKAEPKPAEPRRKRKNPAKREEQRAEAVLSEFRPGRHSSGLRNAPKPEGGQKKRKGGNGNKPNNRRRNANRTSKPNRAKRG